MIDSVLLFLVYSLKSLDVIKSALCCVETCTSLDVGFAKGLAEAGGIPIVVQLAEHSHSKVGVRGDSLL